MAPSKNTLALVSSGRPAISSMFHLVLSPLRLGEAVEQRLALELADLEVVERDVVVDVRRCWSADGRRRSP